MTLLKLDSNSAETIADVQASPDLRQLPVQKVGIKDIRHPVRVKDRSQGEQHTIAQFNMYVELPHNFKGTHMSRFIEILNNYEPEISVQSFKKMLKEMATRLEADTGHIEMTFPYFINKAAPISGVKSLLDYQVTLEGEIKKGYTYDDHESRGSSYKSVPVFEGNFAIWRSQPALPCYGDCTYQCLRLD